MSARRSARRAWSTRRGRNLFHETSQSAANNIGGVRDAEDEFIRCSAPTHSDRRPRTRQGCAGNGKWLRPSKVTCRGLMGIMAMRRSRLEHALDAHDSSSVRAREGATPGAYVRGRVGDVHGLVASGDAGSDVFARADKGR